MYFSSRVRVGQQELREQQYKTPKGEAWIRGHVKLIEQKRALYQSGRKGWGDVESSEVWWRTAAGQHVAGCDAADVLPRSDYVTPSMSYVACYVIVAVRS
ncbi:MAG TPA: hypothetical protein VHZ51_08050 [Ktedonobacteraceae bacterium]|nr:hypothetical protein [Ktedonobacteraceae bacterium]